MAVQQLHYETLLAHSSDYQGSLTLLKSYRPYLELLPSMRRPQDSIVTIPLPSIRVRESIAAPQGPITTVRRVVPLPCDLALLMCDPEWKIKTGVEVFVFIHRPDEDFSELLTRWRQTQIWLSNTYEWLMPSQFEHLLNEGADTPKPLFVAFPETPERIIRGLKGAGLPIVIHTSEFWNDLAGKAKSAQAAAAPSVHEDSPYLDTPHLIDDTEGSLTEGRAPDLSSRDAAANSESSDDNLDEPT
ncbi:MAG: hypothetical protein AAFZ80_02750 [Cyanobacteria bacterium P01_A01_bin.105]